MNIDATKARSIFTSAVENYAPDQWDKFINDACGGDVAMKGRVKLLLKAHQGDDSFLDRGEDDNSAHKPTTDQPPLEKPGIQIGPYKLLQQIGEGGMGVVYMAEQTQPVERRVALKIIKPGMDSRQVVARFEAERQALAMMDHPNIAKVLDAGTTESGRPYFVMELVKGVPITKYCDEKRLNLRNRLELMIPVCQAIQHAHQKGIIHRDIKPTNVLIAQYDGKPVPKVIDFGVAKATAQKLTERTMFTELGQVVGTLEYMSPEQAELNQLDIDTRSDIYSLGVLLYELLTGSTPFDKQKLRTAAFHEMLRIIREEEPPKPSTKLSSSGTLPSIAANRQSEPARLSKAVHGELDWIVMKALEKDRSRRYETANGFAADVQRYLADEPVQACPPSASYRFRKFARRNKATLTTAAVVAALLILGTTVSTWQAIRATQAEAQAKVNETRALSEQHKASAAADAERAAKEAESAQRQRAEESFRIARESVSRVLTMARFEPTLKDAKTVPFQRKLLQAAIEFYTELIQTNPADGTAYGERAGIHLLLADAAAAKADYERAAELAPDDRRILVKISEFYGSAPEFRDLPRALRFAEHLVAIHPNYSGGRMRLSGIYARLGRKEDQLAQIKAAVAIDDDNEWPHGALAGMLYRDGDIQGALDQLAIGIRKSPEAHLQYSQLADILWSQKRFDEALAAQKDAEIRANSFKPDEVGREVIKRARMLAQLTRYTEAVTVCRRGIELCSDPSFLSAAENVARIMGGKSPAEGKEILEAISQRRMKLLSKDKDDPETFDVQKWVDKTLNKQKVRNEATRDSPHPVESPRVTAGFSGSDSKDSQQFRDGPTKTKP